MNEKGTPSHLRQRLDIHLEDYRTSCNEILTRVEYQQKLLNYQLLAAGVVVGACIRFAESGSSTADSLAVRYFLLLSPLVFISFSWSFSNHDMMIQSRARYVQSILKPKIQTLVPAEKVLEWEEFLFRDRELKTRSLLILLPGGEEYLLPLMLPLILISIYFCLAFLGNSEPIQIAEGSNAVANALWIFQYILFGLDIFVFILTIILKVRVSLGYRAIWDRPGE